MKSSRLLCLFIALSLFLQACNNNASDKETTKKDSAVVETKTVDSVAVKASGMYSGYLPCADCAGIMTYVVLNPDMTYRLEETYTGKNDTAVLKAGGWKTSDGKIVLYDQANSVLVSYLPEDNKLVQLDIEGKRIAGNLGDKYVLVKSSMAKNDNAAWNEKKKAGVDFLGIGNEPFWSLEIEKDSSVVFNTPNMKKAVTTPYADPVIINGVRNYHIQTASTTLDISITPGFCSDGMSDAIHEYKVTLKYNGKKYSGCGVMLNSL